MDNLPNLEVVRAVASVARAKPADGDGMPKMEVRFSAFDEWYEIDSFFEGNFIERTEHGAFAKTIAEQRAQVRSLFDHGFDPSIGNKVLGTISDLREDKDSPVGEVDLFDTSYNRDLLPGLKAGVYGSSMRMRVVKDEWVKAPDASTYNPKALPERTIKEVRLYEFGPVTFPANPQSTASVRSATDDYYQALRARDPQLVDDLTRSRQSQIALDRNQQPPAGTAKPAGAAEPATTEPAASHSGGLTPGARRQRLTPSLKGKPQCRTSTLT